MPLEWPLLQWRVLRGTFLRLGHFWLTAHFLQMREDFYRLFQYMYQSVSKRIAVCLENLNSFRLARKEKDKTNTFSAIVAALRVLE